MSIEDSSTKTGLAAPDEFEDDEMRDLSTVETPSVEFERVIKNAGLKIPNVEWRH